MHVYQLAQSLTFFLQLHRISYPFLKNFLSYLVFWMGLGCHFSPAFLCAVFLVVCFTVYSSLPVHSFSPMFLFSIAHICPWPTVFRPNSNPKPFLVWCNEYPPLPLTLPSAHWLCLDDHFPLFSYIQLCTHFLLDSRYLLEHILPLIRYHLSSNSKYNIRLYIKGLDIYIHFLSFWIRLNDVQSTMYLCFLFTLF